MAQAKKFTMNMFENRLFIGEKLKEVKKERHALERALRDIIEEENRLRGIMQEPYCRKHTTASRKINLNINEKHLKGAIFEK